MRADSDCVYTKHQTIDEPTAVCRYLLCLYQIVINKLHAIFSISFSQRDYTMLKWQAAPFQVFWSGDYSHGYIIHQLTCHIFFFYFKRYLMWKTSRKNQTKSINLEVQNNQHVFHSLLTNNLKIQSEWKKNQWKDWSYTV